MISQNIFVARPYKLIKILLCAKLVYYMAIIIIIIICSHSLVLSESHHLSPFLRIHICLPAIYIVNYNIMHKGYCLCVYFTLVDFPPFWLPRKFSTLYSVYPMPVFIARLTKSKRTLIEFQYIHDMWVIFNYRAHRGTRWIKILEILVDWLEN